MLETLNQGPNIQLFERKQAKFAIKIQEKKLLLTRSVHFSVYKHEQIYNANYDDLILFFDG